MLADDDAVSTTTRRRAPLLRWVIGLALGLVAAWVAVNAAGGFAEASDALGDVNAAWLAPAFVVEALSYVILGVKLQQLIGPQTVTVTEGVEIGFVVSGFGLLTPASPAEGLAIAMAHLRRRGVPRRHVAFAIGFSEWFSLRVFLLASAINLVIVAIVEPDPIGDVWPFLVFAALAFAVLAISARLVQDRAAMERIAGAIGALRRPSHRRALADRRASGADFHREARAFIGEPRRRLQLTALTAGAMLGDVACLWFAMLAAGGHVGFDVAMLAVTMASFSILIPLVPGGIGFVEATIPAVAHHFGMPYEQGLAAALVYRGMGTFLPAGIGLGAIVALRRREHV